MDTSRQLSTHGDGLLDMGELARTLLESMVNKVMDAQADMLCEDGANSRNGDRERGLATPVGDITLRIPKLRAGTYFPECPFERYSRAGRAVAAAGEFTVRGLAGVEVPYLFLDATYVKCRRGGRVQSTAAVTAIGVGSDGVRRMLGIAAVDTETYAGRPGFLRSLRERGLSGVRLVVGDAHVGLARAVSECLPAAGWQRCVVHLERDVCSLLPSKRHRAMAAGVMQAVFRESDPATVRSAYRAAIDAVGALSARAGALFEEAEADALASLDFPPEHRRGMRSNNV